MKQEKNIWEQSRVELFQKLDCRETGLSQEDAADRLAKYGANELHAGKQKSVLQIFLGQFADFLVLILILAAVISACMGDVESMIVILAVITMNAILGTVQTVKASASLDSLKQMSAPTAKVLRDGQIVQIPGREVVPGDVVILEAGDSVCADGRLLECASLKCAESALTGESLPVEKDTELLSGETALGDRKNMVFSGSFVTYGRGRFLVTATGMDTEMGKIAQLLKNTEERKTPLQVSLDQFGRKLSIIILVICAVLFGVSVLWRHENVMNAFLFAVALAVAAIPEALSSIVTIVLSFGTRKMARENAIIRHLQAVEGLGSVSVICSDKTGTLTQNRMTVRKLYTGGEVIDAKDADFRDPLQEPLLRTALLCSDAVISGDTEIGDPTETALVRLGETNGFDEDLVRNRWPRLTEIPFDSDRKMMSTVHKAADGTIIQYTKGAPDEVLKRCTRAMVNGSAVEMTDEIRASILAANKSMADRALRVLCAAKRNWSSMPESTEPEFLEQDLTYVGLSGMIDPVRPEVKTAIAECREAGIRPIMITGDHRDTAVAIANELGILGEGQAAITGAELNEMDDATLEASVDRYSVYARVQPEHKVRIVTAWRRRGAVTAMTGDGVNDAPSIKSADIGVAMGITGTDVTKNVADMVLSDDNFATIVGAVAEGRRIYDNIRKAIAFLLASNMSEVLGVFTAALLGFTLLNPVHLLFINLITDCFPALALGLERPEPDIMDRPPRSAKDGVFSGGLGFDIAYQGVLITVITLISYLIGHCMEVGYFEMPRGVSPDGMTMAFLTMSMCEIFHSFNMRTQHGSIFAKKGQNMWLWGSFALALLLTSAVVFIDPIAEVFSLATDFGFDEFVIAFALALSTIVIVEIVKCFQRMYYKNKR